MTIFATIACLLPLLVGGAVLLAAPALRTGIATWPAPDWWSGFDVSA